jgi:hypothetical protein
MMRGMAAANPDAYVAALSGWQRERVEMLRAAVNAGADFDEIIKWGNLVFVSNGLCLLIRAEDHRVLLGFWRGKRLTQIDPRIRPSGKYELGNLIMTEGTAVDATLVTELAAAAAALNAELGDPTKAAAAR